MKGMYEMGGKKKLSTSRIFPNAVLLEQRGLDGLLARITQDLRDKDYLVAVLKKQSGSEDEPSSWISISTRESNRLVQVFRNKQGYWIDVDGSFPDRHLRGIMEVLNAHGLYVK